MLACTGTLLGMVLGQLIVLLLVPFYVPYLLRLFDTLHRRGWI